MNPKYKTLLQAVLFAIVGLVVLGLVYRSNNRAYQEECLYKGITGDCELIDKVISDVSTADYKWIVLSLLLFMLSNISRAARWQIILEPLGYKPGFFNSVSAIMVAYLANLGLPRSGEFVRAGLLSKYEGYPVEKVMGTIVLDRIADVVMLLLTIGITAILSYNTFFKYLQTNSTLGDKFSMLTNVSVLLPLFLLGLAVLGILYTYRLHLLNSKIGGKVWNLLVGFKEGVMSITKLRRPWAFVGHSILIWLCYYVMTYVVFFAFEPTELLGPVAGLVVFVFGTLGIVFPSPGGMGSYHYLVGEGLALYGVGASDAFSFANIIFFSVQLFCNILFGIVALVLLPIVNKEK